MDRYVITLLKDIKEKPGMHIGMPSFSNLYLYINGYRSFVETQGDAVIDAGFWRMFDCFTRKSEKITCCENYEKDVFDAFFTHLELYLESLGESPLDSAPSLIVDWKAIHEHLYPEMAFRRLLNDIKKKPKRYIGKPSLKRLIHFLDGYIIAGYLHNRVVVDTGFWKRFDCFVKQRYSILNKEAAHKIISSVSLNEETAFYSFFELFDSFLEQESQGNGSIS